MRQNGIAVPLEPKWADFRYLQRPPRKLIDKIVLSEKLYPSELLFIHRDAERETHTIRKNEIIEEIETARKTRTIVPPVCVIPVRMMEAWLMFNKDVIRRASGNPRGKTHLPLPSPSSMESLPDPKNVLHQMLRSASELTGRRLKTFRPEAAIHKIVDLIDDFSPLRSLGAFEKLESDLQQVIKENKWNTTR